MRRVIGVSVSLVLAGLAVLVAEERPDEAMFWKIRQEATSRSQILGTVHMFTDVYGPRLTGSPNLKAAGEWAVQQMTSWGLKNGHLEPWDFGSPGWANERFTAHSPRRSRTRWLSKCWPGRRARLASRAARRSRSRCRRDRRRTDLASYLETIKSTIKGKMVLVGPHQTVPVTFNPAPLRREDADVRRTVEQPARAGTGSSARGPAIVGDDRPPHVRSPTRRSRSS